MKQMNTVFRALTEYRRRVTQNRDCVSFRDQIVKAKSAIDKIELTQTVCDIDEEWVIAIEQGLEHVEKAIKEERQFIRSEGEVVPIEKAKRVSRDSIEHLARHSNFITRKQKVHKNLIPDQIYIVKRDSDYSVYENRFLYTLLCNLEDFITLRYEAIISLVGVYNVETTLSRKIDTRNKKLIFDMKLVEERRDDPFIKERNPSKDVIDRIATILRAVQLFLDTPLMQMVAKSAKVKPPITKTNVLKMDKNFKGAVNLYDFIFAYEKPGYEIKTQASKIDTFNGEMAEELSEIAALSSFLTYEYSLGLKPLLKKNLDAQIEREKQEEILKHLEQLKSLKRRISESGESPDEYMLQLEKQNRQLENEVARIQTLQAEIEAQNTTIAKLYQEIEMHKQIEADKDAELVRVIAEHNEAISQLKAECAATIRENDERNAAAIAEMEGQVCERITAATDAAASELEQYKARQEVESESVRQRAKQEVEAIEAKLKSLQDNMNATIEEARKTFAAENQRYIEQNKKLQAETEHAVAEHRRIAESKRLNDAMLNSLKYKYNLFTAGDDFTSEEAFNDLEKQYNEFTKFFNATWKKVKKVIRANAVKEKFAAAKKKKQKKSVEFNERADVENGSFDRPSASETSGISSGSDNGGDNDNQ